MQSKGIGGTQSVREVDCLRFEQGGAVGAKERVEQGWSLFLRGPELSFPAKIVYRELVNPATKQRYIKLLTVPEVGHSDSLDVSMTGYKAQHNLALIYQDMPQWPEAEAQGQAAVQNHL